MPAHIPPRVLKGFRDMLPEHELLRERLFVRIRTACARYGFVPIDTPILEYSEILLGKGGAESDTQLYRFTDQGGRDVAMRYDLTVPLARFVAQHLHELSLPFRRYQIGKVFRGEKPQKGRFREFVQCDFDIVGSTHFVSDYDILQLSIEILSDIVGAQSIEIRLSHRNLLMLFAHGSKRRAEMAQKLTAMRVLIDKIHKIGAEAVRSELCTLLTETDEQEIDALMEFIEPQSAEPMRGDTGGTIMQRITEDVHAPISDTIRDEYEQTEAFLTLLLTKLRAHNAQIRIIVDPSIMRGLDYYTGLIFEVYHRQHPHIGSLCSGGRYDSLTARYHKESIPAVGGSVGIDRILSLPEIAKTLPTDSAVDAILFNERHTEAVSINVAHRLRQQGISVEIYPQEAKLQKQFAYAEKKGIAYGIIIHYNDGEEIKKEAVPTAYELKNLRRQERFQCSGANALIQLADKIKTELNK